MIVGITEKEQAIEEFIKSCCIAKKRKDPQPKAMARWIAGLEEIPPSHYEAILWVLRKDKLWPKNYVERIHMIDLAIDAIVNLTEVVKEAEVPKIPWFNRFSRLVERWWIR